MSSPTVGFDVAMVWSVLFFSRLVALATNLPFIRCSACKMLVCVSTRLFSGLANLATNSSRGVWPMAKAVRPLSTLYSITSARLSKSCSPDSARNCIRVNRRGLSGSSSCFFCTRGVLLSW